MACFTDTNVSQGSVATYARCGGIYNIHLTANLPRNLTVIFENRLRIDRIMVMSLWPRFLAHPVGCTVCANIKVLYIACTYIHTHIYTYVHAYETSRWPMDDAQGCSGGTRGDGVPHFFRQRGRVPHSPPLFGLKFVQKLVHCCNWLLTETQCKIISVQQNFSGVYECTCT